MRKILVAVSNVLSTILAGIAFGLGGLTALNFLVDGKKPDPKGNFYQSVFSSYYSGSVKYNAGLIVVFILFCIATFITLVTMFNFKGRRYVMIVNALLFVSLGITLCFFPQLFSNSFKGVATETFSPSHFEITSGMKGVASLIILSGVFSLVGAVIDIILAKKEA